MDIRDVEDGKLVGVDVGGTFTDFVWRLGSELRVLKVPTTPKDQSIAIASGMDLLGVGTEEQVIHGTTVATNALLERRGARTALVTTKGFADVLAIGRQNRPSLYGISQIKPPALIPSAWRFEVDERIDADGSILASLNEQEVEELAGSLSDEGIESLAIVLLFSFLNPKHEQRIAELLSSRVPDINLSISSDLLPEYREYERTSTVAISAYVQPLVAAYLNRLQDALKGRTIYVMQSNGGLLSVEGAAEQAGRLVLSGPAGGVVGAFEVACASLETTEPQIITFDMGGTSTDVALCPGSLPRSAEGEITSLPIRFPSMDIHTVGAGGGSLAWVDKGGVLRVGPESAGADPGPACYGRGGVRPTVTDANLLLGRIPASGFQGGDMELDIEAASNALASLGSQLGLDPYETALGVIRVANAVMERALRKISIEQGYDPRSYTLVPFGGAGALHACELADALGIRQILIPKYPGVLSAWGLTIADSTYDASIALLAGVDSLISNPDIVRNAYEELVRRVRSRLPARQGEPVYRAWLDMRYKGQSFELEVPVAVPVDTTYIRKAAEVFHDMHERRFGYRLADTPVDVVALRVQGSYPGMAFEHLNQTAQLSGALGDQTEEIHDVWFDSNGSTPTRFIHRSHLRSGDVFKDPLTVGQYDATLLVFPSWRVSVDLHENILLWRTLGAP